MWWSFSRSLLLVAIVPLLVPPSLLAQGTTSHGPSLNDAKATMSTEEWGRVAKQRNPVKRVRKLLEIASDRLKRSRRLTSQGKYGEVSNLIIQYRIQISYALRFIQGLPDKQEKKRRNAYKEFDLRVRRQIHVLEELRRQLPLNDQAVAKALFTAKRLRIIAMNGFSGAEIIKVPEDRP